MNLMKMPYRTSHMVVKGMLNILKLPTPPTLIGSGMIKRFPEIIALCNVRKAMIVTQTVIEEKGLLMPFLSAMEASGIETAIYHMPNASPSFEDIYNGLDFYYKENCDGIIAFGGGTCIDCGKIIAAKVTNDRPIPKMKGLFKLSRKLPPFFAVPTTAGSGAEATIDALILDTTNCEKFTISDAKRAPLAVVLDPELCADLSREQTIYGALDTLTRAIEAYLNRYDKNRVLELARSSVCTVLNHLEKLLEEPSNLTERQAMLQAAHDSGLAKTRSCPGYTQTIAHTLSAWYNLSEAHVAAIILPQLLNFNLESCRKKYAELALALGLGEASDDETLLSERFVHHIEALCDRLDIPDQMPQIRSCDIPEITHQILKEANAVYPVPKLMDAQACTVLLEKVQLQH